MRYCLVVLSNAKELLLHLPLFLLFFLSFPTGNLLFRPPSCRKSIDRIAKSTPNANPTRVC
jgi:hypothetical protein